VIIVWPEQAQATEERCRPTSWIGVCAVFQAVLGMVLLVVCAWISAVGNGEWIPLASFSTAAAVGLIVVCWFAYLGRPWALNWAFGAFITTAVFSHLLRKWYGDVFEWYAFAQVFHVGAAVAFGLEHARMRFAARVERRAFPNPTAHTVLAAIVAVVAIAGGLTIGIVAQFDKSEAARWKSGVGHPIDPSADDRALLTRAGDPTP
jgi:hypothetical protein